MRDKGKATMTFRARAVAFALAVSLLPAASLLAAGRVQAETDYPAREIRIVIGFTAGGTTDVIARLVGQELLQRWGRPIVIDNRPGAGGNIGADIVAKAKPDGYTLAIGSVGPLAVNATLYKTIPYDNLRDLTPITMIAHVPNMLVVNARDVQATTLAEFIALAKAKPGSIFYGSTGSGTMSHLTGEMLRAQAGIEITHVPFKGATGVTDMLGGQSVCCMFATIPSVIAHVRAGRLRALAVTSAKRSAAAPDVPSIAESGFPGFDGSSWFGLVGPAGMPREIVLKLQTEIASILGKPEIRERLIGLGADPVGDSPEAFAAYMRSETAKWGAVVTSSNIKAD